MRPCLRFGVLGVLAAVLMLPGSPAAAHESRAVGPFEVVVGWWTEPAFANQPNGPEISISRGGEPVVEGVELQVEVIYGDETTTLDIEPAFVVGVFGEPGNYNAELVPTRAGTWEFHFTGTIEGEDFDETFTSGPETFGDIIDPASAAFPVADPSNAELAVRLQQETERLSVDLASANDDASAARTFGYVGTGLGAVALILALVALLRRRPAG